MIDELNPDIVVKEYKSLVAGIAYKYKNSGLLKEDLMQEGMLGLLHACNRFDNQRNIRFSTYATYWVKKFILLAISREYKQTMNSSDLNCNYLPDNKAETAMDAVDIYQLRKENLIHRDIPIIENQILNLSYKCNKTIKEIAMEMNITPEKVRQIRAKAIRRMKVLMTQS